MSGVRQGADGDRDPATVTITNEGDWYVARDDSSGVASQGKSVPEALTNLADALRLHAEEDDVDPTEPDAPWF